MNKTIRDKRFTPAVDQSPPIGSTELRHEVHKEENGPGSARALVAKSVAKPPADVHQAAKEVRFTPAVDQSAQRKITESAADQGLKPDSRTAHHTRVAKSVAKALSIMQRTDPSEWADARRIELDRIERLFTDQLADTQIPTAVAASKYKAARFAVLHPLWMPKRPPRRMPPAHRVANYWAGQDPFTVDSDNPACFRCHLRVDEWSNLQRAHLVDRFRGGLDHAANLAMLCYVCHAIMPLFDAHESAHALAWVANITTTHARSILNQPACETTT